MRKLFLAALAALLPATGLAQAHNGYYCAHTGFTVNLAATTKSFQCRPEALIRGQGTLSFASGDNTVTCSGTGATCFTNVAAVDSLPGADDTFWNTSAIVVWVAGQAQFYNVNTRTSNTSLEVADGTTAPAATVTTTDWSYWNTTCYRAATAYNLPTGTANQDDQRLWNVLGSSVIHVNMITSPVAFIGVVGANSTISAANVISWTRPSFLKTYGVADTAVTFGSNTAGAFVVKNTSSPNFMLYGVGAEFTMSVQSTAAGAYAYTCLVRAEGAEP